MLMMLFLFLSLTPLSAQTPPDQTLPENTFGHSQTDDPTQTGVTQTPPDGSSVEIVINPVVIPDELNTAVPDSPEVDRAGRMVEMAFNYAVTALTIIGTLFGTIKVTKPLLYVAAAGYIVTRATPSKTDDVQYAALLVKLQTLGVNESDVMALVNTWSGTQPPPA